MKIFVKMQIIIQRSDRLNKIFIKKTGEGTGNKGDKIGETH